MEKTAPVRHTKLAYINSVAKPPREVLRRQRKHHTETFHSPAANSKRTAFAASPPPKKRHSAPVPVVSQGRAELSAQLKGLYIGVYWS